MPDWISVARSKNCSRIHRYHWIAAAPLGRCVKSLIVWEQSWFCGPKTDDGTIVGPKHARILKNTQNCSRNGKRLQSLPRLSSPKQIGSDSPRYFSGNSSAYVDTNPYLRKSRSQRPALAHLSHCWRCQCAASIVAASSNNYCCAVCEASHPTFADCCAGSICYSWTLCCLVCACVQNYYSIIFLFILRNKNDLFGCHRVINPMLPITYVTCVHHRWNRFNERIIGRFKLGHMGFKWHAINRVRVVNLDRRCRCWWL